MRREQPCENLVGTATDPRPRLSESWKRGADSGRAFMSASLVAERCRSGAGGAPPSGQDFGQSDLRLPRCRDPCNLKCRPPSPMRARGCFPRRRKGVALEIGLATVMVGFTAPYGGLLLASWRRV